MCRLAAAGAKHRPEASGGGPRSGWAGCRSRGLAAVGVGRYCGGGARAGYAGGRGGPGGLGALPPDQRGSGGAAPGNSAAHLPAGSDYLLFPGTGKPLAAL